MREQVAQQPPLRRASLPPEDTAHFTTRSRYTAPASHTYVEIDEEGGTCIPDRQGEPAPGDTLLRPTGMAGESRGLRSWPAQENIRCSTLV
jgi:hypothetical protein